MSTSVNAKAERFGQLMPGIINYFYESSESEGDFYFTVRDELGIEDEELKEFGLFDDEDLEHMKEELESQYEDLRESFADEEE